MHRIFSNFAYILLLGMSGMGLLMGKIRPFSMELLPFLPLKNGLWPNVVLLFMISDTLLHRALLTLFLCRQTSVPTLAVVRYLYPASIFNPGNPHIQNNQLYRLLHSVVVSTFVSRDVNNRFFYRQSLPSYSREKSK